MVIVRFVDNLGIGPGSVQTTPRTCPNNTKVKAQFPKVMERVEVKVGRARTTLVKEMEKDSREKVRGKVRGTRVHVSTVAKFPRKRQNA